MSFAIALAQSFADSLMEILRTIQQNCAVITKRSAPTSTSVNRKRSSRWPCLPSTTCSPRFRRTQMSVPLTVMTWISGRNGRRSSPKSLIVSRSSTRTSTTSCSSRSVRWSSLATVRSSSRTTPTGAAKPSWRRIYSSPMAPSLTSATGR